MHKTSTETLKISLTALVLYREHMWKDRKKIASLEDMRVNDEILGRIDTAIDEIDQKI